VLDDWVTFVGRYHIVVRGSRHASVRRCEECARVVYFAMAPHYLYPAPSQGIELFDGGNSALVMPQQVFRNVNLARWRSVEVTRLPMPSAPSDGLGDLAVVAH
jgi:hypothetical protein